MFFRRDPPSSTIPKVQGATRGQTLFVHITEAQQQALFEMWNRLRDDADLSDVWFRINRAFRDARDHEFTFWGGHTDELTGGSACLTCGLAWHLHRYLRPPYAAALSISEPQYATLSEALTREARSGPVGIKEAWEAISRAHSAAPVHLYGTSEVESWADLRFRGDVTCAVCGLCVARHTN